MALAAHITQPTVATTTTTHTHTGVRLLADTRNEQCKFRQILRIFGLIKSSIENIRLKCLLHPLHSMILISKSKDPLESPLYVCFKSKPPNS